ncbi:hypothetical protein RRG08_046131 [Elysia crispata]|uniref:TIR domain-containing protein n=1 Tax=Elysia crispata TaxID=231223 RepID=A0AAE1A2A3_9GAST|nr:hypothetical protein RRG08_046131 [Elysia crispata]
MAYTRIFWLLWACILVAVTMDAVKVQEEVDHPAEDKTNSGSLRFVSESGASTAKMPLALERRSFIDSKSGVFEHPQRVDGRAKRNGDGTQPLFPKSENRFGGENSLKDRDSQGGPGTSSPVKHFDFRSSANHDPLWKKLKYAENYGKIRVLNKNGSERTYLPPHDYFRCGSCLCSTTSRGQMVHAECRKINGVNIVVHSIPQDLPLNTISLDLTNNPLEQFETEKLALYKSLLSVTASTNLIKSLRKRDCELPVSLENLDLSDNSISYLEDGALSCMINLTHLTLRYNDIAELTNGSLEGLAKLKKLDLANNNIHKIEVGAFLHSRDLRDLDLSLNKRLSLSRKYRDAFKPLSVLEVLNISGCANVGWYPTDVLLQLPALQELAVNGEREAFDSKLSELKNLTSLTLGIRSYCRTKNFTKSYFSGLNHLTTLKIDGCIPTEYSPHMFDANPKIINFEIFRIMGKMKDVLQILCYLPNLNATRSVTMKQIIKHYKVGALVLLSKADVKCLSKMKNLVSLNLDGDTISQFGRLFITGLPPSLEKLSVRENLLMAFESLVNKVFIFHDNFKNLRELHEDSQGVKSAQSRSYHTNQHIRDHSDENAVDIRSAEAQTNLLRARKADGLSLSSSEWSLSLKNHSWPYYLEYYSASNAIQLGLTVFSRKQHFQIGSINMSGTLTTNWGEYPVSRMPYRAVIADLSNNRCATLNKKFFFANNSLVELHAKGNFFGPLFSKDFRGSLLSKLTNLEYLDLSRNHLFHLPWLLFQGMPRLRVLKLSSNNIDYLDIKIGHMTFLVHIDLSRNSIWSISERTLKNLDHLATNGTISVDLTYNPLPCTCGGLELFRWMSVTRVRMLNKDLLVCINSEKQQEFIGDLSTRYLSLQRKCVSKKILILAASFSGAIFLLLIGFVWVFQKRWWILYMWNLAVSNFYGYKTSNGTRNRQQAGNGSRSRSQASGYSFDAFFVYSSSSSEFVLDECLEELEVNRSHRLCVEDRDFLPGSYVPCNITSAVRSSKTTVVVLDQNFRSVGWTHYAVEMAQVEAVRSRRNVLHLLFVGSPPDRQLPGVYLKVLREGWFSEAPPTECSPDVRDAFWNSFSQKLGHTGAQADTGLVLSD